MAWNCTSAFFWGALVAFTGCDPGIGKDASVEGTRPIFDPDASQIPLPNDALYNPATGLLQVPAEPGDSELTSHIKAGINRLNGWIPASTLTIPFDAELDKATLNGDTVRLYDVTNAPTFERVPPDTYFVAFNVGRSPATESPYTLFVRAKPIDLIPKDFEFGHRYIVVVTDGVRDLNGRPLIGTPAMELLKSRTPLVNAYGRSQTILPDANAAQLEATRAGSYAPALDAIESEVSREAIVAHAAFRIQSNPRPVFEPVPLPVFPSPYDSEDKKADADPATARVEVLFDVAYDPTSVNAGAKLFKRGAGLTEVPFTAETTTQPNAEGKHLLTLIPSKLEPSTTYQVVLTDEITSPDGSPSRPGSFYALVSAPQALWDSEAKTLNSPFVDSTLDSLIIMRMDPATATLAQWEVAYTALTGSLAQLEAMRVWYKPFIDDAVAAGIAPETISVLWTFTTAAP